MKLKILLVLFQVTLFAMEHNSQLSTMNLEQINKKIRANESTINWHENYLEKQNLSEYSINGSLKTINATLTENYELCQKKYVLEKEKLEEKLELLHRNKLLLKEQNVSLKENSSLKERLTYLQSLNPDQQEKFLEDNIVLIICGGGSMALAFGYFLTSTIHQLFKNNRK